MVKRLWFAFRILTTQEGLCKPRGKTNGPPCGARGSEEDRQQRLLFRLGDFANHLRRSTRLVYAEGLFRQKVSGGRKRPCAAPHADMAEFAAAALPFQVVVIAQLTKDRRVVPDIGKGLFAQVAGESGQVATGKNLAFVRDEAYPCAS